MLYCILEMDCIHLVTDSCHQGKRYNYDHHTEIQNIVHPQADMCHHYTYQLLLTISETKKTFELTLDTME